MLSICNLFFGKECLHTNVHMHINIKSVLLTTLHTYVWIYNISVCIYSVILLLPFPRKDSCLLNFKRMWVCGLNGYFEWIFNVSFLLGKDKVNSCRFENVSSSFAGKLEFVDHMAILIKRNSLEDVGSLKTSKLSACGYFKADVLIGVCVSIFFNNI